MPNSKKRQNNKSRSPLAISVNNREAMTEMSKTSHVSRGSSDYARCVANPFDGPVGGIPSFPSVKSIKQRAWAKGVLNTSPTTGFGYIVVNPSQLSFNDAVGVGYTNSNFNDTVIGVPGSGSGNAFITSNSQYDTSQLGTTAASLQFRVVACGVRVRYVGSELERGGQKVGLMDPTHDTLVGRGISDFDAELDSKRFAVSREWTYVLYRPITNSELQYQSTVDPSFSMGFTIQASSATTSLTYEFEAYVVTEFQGRTIRGQTPTLHDPTGFAAVDYTLQTSKHLLPTTSNNSKREGSVMSDVIKYIAHGVSHTSLQPSVNVLHSQKQLADRATTHGGKSNGSFWSYLYDGIKGAIPLAFELLPALL